MLEALIGRTQGAGTRRRLRIIAAAFCLYLLSWQLTSAQSRTEDVTFSSAALGRQAVFSVVIPSTPPPAGGYAVLMILHGLGRNHHTLTDNTEALALLNSQSYLIVLPDTATGWWIDSTHSGTKYSSMLLEVIDEVNKRYPASVEASRWGVMGWSMGGYGAMRFAEDHPEKVSFIGSIIGLLDFPRVEGLPEGQRFSVDAKVFGADRAGWSAENPSKDLAPLRGKEIALVIADQAFDRTMNENFLHAASNAGLNVSVRHIKGEHVFASVLHGLQLLLPVAATHFAGVSAGSR